MSSREDLVRRGRIAELREELDEIGASIAGLIDAVRVQISDVFGYDELDGERIVEAAKLLCDAINRRKALLAEIERLKRA